MPPEIPDLVQKFRIGLSADDDTLNLLFTCAKKLANPAHIAQDLTNHFVRFTPLFKLNDHERICPWFFGEDVNRANIGRILLGNITFGVFVEFELPLEYLIKIGNNKLFKVLF